jgi:hypothetical protein
MRKEYGNALRHLFTERMRSELPDWRPVPPPKPWYWPGERLFVNDRHDPIWLIIVLQPDLGDHDAFNIEIGWSVHARVPELGMRPSLDGPNGVDPARQDEYLCRLSNLLPAEHRLHGWVDGWVVDERTFSADPAATMAALVERQTRIDAEQARSRLAPFVDDAWSVLRDRGLPWLDEQVALLAGNRKTKLTMTSARAACRMR